MAGPGQQLRTLLGSCLGLALYDRQHKVGGLAHIVLPRSPDPVAQKPGKFVDTALPELMARMQQLVGSRLRLSAKIAGGASMFSTTVANNIGLQNIEACELLLNRYKIPLLAKHCGGQQGRRMTLHTMTGLVLVEIVGQDRIEL